MSLRALLLAIAILPMMVAAPAYLVGERTLAVGLLVVSIALAMASALLFLLQEDNPLRRKLEEQAPDLIRRTLGTDRSAAPPRGAAPTPTPPGGRRTPGTSVPRPPGRSGRRPHDSVSTPVWTLPHPGAREVDDYGQATPSGTRPRFVPSTSGLVYTEPLKDSEADMLPPDLERYLIEDVEQVFDELVDTHPNPVLATLPHAMSLIASELRALDLPEETASDCAACPVASEPGGLPSPLRPLSTEARCCTFHPAMPNFLLGRALRRGGQAAALVLARIDEIEGVYLAGISPSEAWQQRYKERGRSGFGRDLSLRCPYWSGGDLSCGIWEDRGAHCRTWFCRHADGPRGLALWSALRKLLFTIEGAIATWLAQVERPPAMPATPEEMADWYVRCANRADRITPVEALEMRDAAVEQALQRVLRCAQAHHRPVPELLITAMRSAADMPQGVLVTGYSALNGVLIDRQLTDLLARFDGATPWHEVLDQFNAQAGLDTEPVLVEALYRAGVLYEPMPLLDELPPGAAPLPMLSDEPWIAPPQMLDDLPKPPP